MSKTATSARLVSRSGKAVARKAVAAVPATIDPATLSAVLAALGINATALSATSAVISPATVPATVVADFGKVTLSLDGTRADGSARRYKASHRLTVNGRKATAYVALYFDKA